MINLMPDAAKRELRAARANVLISRYVFITLISFGFMALLLVGSYYLLLQTRDSAQQLIDASDIKADVYSDTAAEVQTLSASLDEARTILDQEILFSKLLVTIAQQMPEGTIIDKITLDAATITTTPLTINVYAKTNQDTIQLRDQFQNSNLFSNVNLQSVSENSSGVEGYPVSATMTFTITRGATQ